MSKLQHIGLFLFVLLSAGLALGYRLRGLGARLLGNDLCEQAAP